MILEPRKISRKTAINAALSAFAGISAIIFFHVHEQTTNNVDTSAAIFIAHQTLPPSFEILKNYFPKIEIVTPFKDEKETTVAIAKNLMDWQTVTTKSGDTLSKIFAHLHLKPSNAAQISKLAEVKPFLKHIKPNETLYVEVDNQHNLTAMKYVQEDATLLINKNSADHFTAKVEKVPLTSNVLYKSAVVKHSLAAAATESGMSHAMFQQMVTAFRGEIDLTHNVHPGDHFSVLYNEYYLDGKKHHPGDILVAEYTTHNKTYEAIRFVIPHHAPAYYAIDGHQLGMNPQSIFLSVPLKYKRISSGFSYRRMDPFMHFVHPHLGVDFSAKIGTPVKSIGDGKVSFCATRNGYGKTIMVKYGPKYEALYAHLEKFARNLHVNSYVTRGEVIGYIGSTGWSTGPHLHFEMHIYGVPRDPLKVHLPTVVPGIPHQYLPRFYASAHSLLAELKANDQPKFADNKPESSSTQ